MIGGFKVVSKYILISITRLSINTCDLFFGVWKKLIILPKGGGVRVTRLEPLTK